MRLGRPSGSGAGFGEVELQHQEVEEARLPPLPPEGASLQLVKELEPMEGSHYCCQCHIRQAKWEIH